MNTDLLTNLLFDMVHTGTPLLLVALGEMVCEKSGVLNLGQEGMMLVGAATGFMGAITTGSLILGVLAGMTAGVAMALLFGLVVLTLHANQVAAGLALTILGTGLSAWIGSDYAGLALTAIQPVVIPLLSGIPVIGKALFMQDILVYVSLILAVQVWCFFRFTHAGLITLAIGENPHSASNIGLPVMQVRYLTVLFGGAMTGLGGAYLSLACIPVWTENMTAGRGWISLALVVCASWRIERIILIAWLSGAASVLPVMLQNTGISVSSSLLATLPYVVTIVVLVLLSQNQARKRLMASISSGKPWRPDH